MIFRVMVRPKRSFFRRRTPTVSVENLFFKKYSHFFGVFEESNDTLEYFVEIRDDLIWWEEKAVIPSISQFPCPWEWNTFFVVHPVFRRSTSEKNHQKVIRLPCFLMRTGHRTGLDFCLDILYHKKIPVPKSTPHSLRSNSCLGSPIRDGPSPVIPGRYWNSGFNWGFETSALGSKYNNESNFQEKITKWEIKMIWIILFFFLKKVYNKSCKARLVVSKNLSLGTQYRPCKSRKIYVNKYPK